MADPSTTPLAPGGNGTTTIAGTESTIGVFEVACSGQSIHFRPQDDRGNPLAITGLRSTDDTQLIGVVGSTSGSSMTLTLGDRVTAPIPLHPSPPLTAFVATISLPSPGTYDLGFSYNFTGVPPTGQGCRRTAVRVFDGATALGSVTVDQSKYPDPSVDLIVDKLGVFKSLGSFTSTTGKMTVWLSGPAGDGPVLSGLIRIAPHGNHDPSLVGYIDPTPANDKLANGCLAGRVSIQRYGDWTITWAFTAGDWHGFYYAMPTGNDSTALLDPDEVRTALEGLPSVPPGSVVVTSPDNQSILVQFTGDLAGRALPTLVASDPAFRVTHDDSAGTSVGGQFPVATVNGVAYPLRAASFAPGHPVVAFHIVQDAPVVQRRRCGESTFIGLNYPTTRYGSGYSGRVAMPTTPGAVASCTFEALPGPADYEVALTWPGGDNDADRLECVVQDGQGHVLARLSGIDQSRSPAGLHEDGADWATVARFHVSSPVNQVGIVLNGAGTPGKHCLIDGLRLARTSPDLGIRIKPDDVVLFDAPTGFIGTSAGPMPAARAIRVRPVSGRRLPALPTKTRTMKIGINGYPPAYYTADSCYSNYAIMMGGLLGLVRGPDGNPTRLAAQRGTNRGLASAILSIPSSDGRGAGLGAPNCTAGTWVVQWASGPHVTCELIPLDGTTEVVEDPARRVSGAVNRRYFEVTNRVTTAPAMRFQVASDLANPDGTFACDLHDLAIYPPDVDPDRPGRWRPSFLEKLAGLQCFRFMDFFGTNNLNLVSFDHFPNASQFPLGYPGRTINVPILSIGPPEPDRFCDGVGGTVVRVKTTVPHGLTTGFQIGLRTTDGSSLGLVQGNIIDGTTGTTTSVARDAIDPTDDLNGSPQLGLCHVIDATTFQMGIEKFYGPAARMTNTLTPANGVVVALIAPGSAISPSEAAELCAMQKLEPWVNVPWLADDDCVTRMAQAFVDGTPPGVPVHVEYANEPWNYAFVGFHFANKMYQLSGGTEITPVPFYITRMGQVHRIFRDVWRRAGRDVTEVRRVCGAHQADTNGTTIPMIQMAVAQGISFDELTVASYFSNGPIQGPGDDLLTREQLLDVLALNVEQGITAAQMTAHAEAIAAAAATYPQQGWIGRLQVVNYEGGPEALTTATMSANIARQNHGVHRDPDFLDILLHWMASLEDAGVRLFNIFTMYGVNELYQWAVYEGFNTRPGTGRVALDPANRDDFENLLAVKSETAGALRQWSAMMAPPAPPVAKPSSRTCGLTAFGQGQWSHRYRWAC